MTKKGRYDDEELEILQALESGALKPVNDLAQRANSYREAAAATFSLRGGWSRFGQTCTMILYI